MNIHAGKTRELSLPGQTGHFFECPYPRGRFDSLAMNRKAPDRRKPIRRSDPHPASKRWGSPPSSSSRLSCTLRGVRHEPLGAASLPHRARKGLIEPSSTIRLLALRARRGRHCRVCWGERPMAFGKFLFSMSAKAGRCLSRPGFRCQLFSPEMPPVS